MPVEDLYRLWYSGIDAQALMNRHGKRIRVRFYRSEGGREPVREWLSTRTPDDRRVIGTDIKDVELSWPVGMPLCRPIQGHSNLWEVRSRLGGGRIARVIFTIADGQMILLHGFEKKSEKTPKSELAVAVRRKKEFERHES